VPKQPIVCLYGQASRPHACRSRLSATISLMGHRSTGGNIEGSEIALWALYPRRRLLSARVSAFLDFLKQAFPKVTPEGLAAYIGG